MRNPYVIQYLESLHVEGGGMLCQPAAIQILIPAVPPLTPLPLKAVPVTGYYAAIGYGLTVDRAMVPNAFGVSIIQFGSQPFTGVVTSDFIAEGLEYVAPLTAAQPYYFNLTNLTALNQYFCVTVFFVNIIDQPGYLQVIDALRKLGTLDAVKLLEQMTAAPLPPEGRG